MRQFARFVLMTSVLTASVLCWMPLSAGAADAVDTAVPAQFVHGQVWVTPRIDGRTIRFFTDTGGGWNALDEAAAQRLGLPVQMGETDDGTVRLVDYPAFDAGYGLPDPPAHFFAGRLMLASAEQLRGREGFLGGHWFADGIWAFDYGAGTLRRLPPGATPAGASVALGFQTDARGRRTTHFPSMAIVVDGEALDVLLDTGATATLTQASGEFFGLPEGTDIGTSFIETEVFARWHARHPDWRVIEQADRKGEQLRRMIEVPLVTVAGIEVGPVWFAEQPEGAFQRYMAGMMDRPTWGALGGSGLKYFRMVVDYPGAAAWFEALPARASTDAPMR